MPQYRRFYLTGIAGLNVLVETVEPDAAPQWDRHEEIAEQMQEAGVLEVIEETVV